MNKNELVFSQKDYSGGLNESLPAHLIADNEVPDCLNVDFMKGAQISKRYGNKSWSASAINATWLSLYVFLNTAIEFLYADDQLIYRDKISEQLSGYTLTANSPPINSVQYLSTLIAGNGVDSDLKYDGTSVSTLGGSPPAAKYFEIVYNRVFAAGNPSQPSRVYYTDTGTIETWGVTSYFDVAKDDGDIITGLKFFRDLLIITKTYSIWVADVSGATPSTDWSQYPLNKSLGCVSCRTIQQVENDLYLLTHVGVFPLSRIPTATATQFEVDCISNKVKPTIDTMNKVEWGRSCAINFDNKYWLAIPTGSDRTPKTILVYNYVYNNWSKYKIGANGVGVNQFLVYRNNLYAAMEDKGIRVFNKSYTESLTNDVYESYFYTKATDFNEPTKKRYMEAIINHEAVGSWNATFKRDIDYQNQWNSHNISEIGSESTFGAAIFGTSKFGWGEQLQTRVFLPGTVGKNHGNRIQYYYENSTVGQNFRFNGIDTYFERYKPFGITTAT